MASSVEEAAVTVPLPPRAMAVPLMVSTPPPFKSELPMEVVAATRPVPFVARRPCWMPEMVRLVVEAVLKKPVPETERAVEEAYSICEVEEAKIPVLYHVGVVVAFVVVPKDVAMVQSQGFVRVMVPPKATEPPPVRPLPAETVSAPPFVRSELPMVVVATSCPVLLPERSELAGTERSEDPIVVVAETLPVESVESSAFVSEVR